MTSVEGTVEGDQIDIVQNTSNISFASQFGLSEATTTLLGNLAYKPSQTDTSFRLNIVNDDQVNDFSLKFLKDTSTTSVLSSIAISNTSALGSPSSDELGGKITITTIKLVIISIRV